MHNFKMKVLVSIVSAGTLLSPLANANTDNTPKETTYGDNPNLVRVLAGKTQEAVQNTAEKIGAATEKGIAKIKPTVDNTWQGTKDYTTEQATIARDNTRQGIDTAVKKVKETKDNIVGNGGIPIERGTLSQNAAQSVQYSAVQNNQPIQTQSIQMQSAQTQSIEPQFESAPIPQSASNPQPPNFNNEGEPEIQRQSLPIQSSSANAPVNVEPTSHSPQSDSVEDDVEAGVPR